MFQKILNQNGFSRVAVIVVSAILVLAIGISAYCFYQYYYLPRKEFNNSLDKLLTENPPSDEEIYFDNDSNSPDPTADWKKEILNRYQSTNSSQLVSYSIPKNWVAKEIIYDNSGSRADYSEGDQVVLSVFNQDVPSTFGASKLGVDITDWVSITRKASFWEYNNKKYYSFPTNDKDEYSYKFEFASTVGDQIIFSILNSVI